MGHCAAPDIRILVETQPVPHEMTCSGRTASQTAPREAALLRTLESAQEKAKRSATMKVSNPRWTADPAGHGAEPGGRGAMVLGALLFLLVAGVFLAGASPGFLTYHHPVYVTENAHVNGGLTWANVEWAFHSTEASNRHPLTWLSHMADCQVFGLHPWGHHLTSVLLDATRPA